MLEARLRVALELLAGTDGLLAHTSETEHVSLLLVVTIIVDGSSVCVSD